MNVSDIADFADILAAIGVIASLLFVAFQVRRNTKAIRNQHFEATLDHLASQFSRSLDERVATIIDKGRKNFNDLSDPEKLTFGAWANEYIMGASRLTSFGQQGLLDPAVSALGRAPEFRDLGLNLLSQPFDVVDAAALDQFEKLLELGELGIVAPAVGGVPDAADSSAGLDPGNDPVAPPVHVHPKDFEARDHDTSRGPVGRRGGFAPYRRRERPQPDC